MEKKAEFISNKPLGEDLFDGQSQDKVAMAIMQHIQNVDSKAEPKDEDEAENALPRIIGIEGKWGSGKSNTLLQLKKKLGKGYYFFTYDAWGNQEDLQRRSILQLLTNKLIKDEKLGGDTQIKIISSAIDVSPKPLTCTWQERVDNLTSRKSSTHNITVPSIYDSTKYFVLMIVITGILVPLLNSIKVRTTPCWYTYLATFLAFVPLIWYCLLMCSMKKKRAKAVKSDEKSKYIGWSWNEMWQMYQTTGRTETSTYTVSDLEPSVTEFRDWMTDLSKALVDNTKLVIVFDNMDRLPMEKVRQLWSSIQTFFADKGYRRVWCIIPFDREHLANAFNDADGKDDKIQLVNYFIEKTFPVVYRIPDPIITDYKVVFDRLFEQAFGKREDQELINRCYRLKYVCPNMREIISFINKLVALTNQWNDEVKLSSMALFLLHQDEILKSSENSIVKREYLKGMESLFEATEDLDTDISALTYGVCRDDAAQLPMKNLIIQALNNEAEAEFSEYAKKNAHFYSILKEVVNELDAALLNNAINHIAKLSFEGLPKQNSDDLKTVWGRLSGQYLKSKEKETTFRKEVKSLMTFCINKVAIGKYFLKMFTSSDNPHKGPEWYQVYKEVAVFTKEQKITLSLPEKQLESSDFVDYIRTAKEEYRHFPIKCDNAVLNKFCYGQIVENNDMSDILRLAEGDSQYDFTDLKMSVRKLIEEQEATSSNFGSTLKALKFLSNEPMRLNLDGTYLTGLQYAGELIPDYRVMLMLAGKEVAVLDDKDYEAMAKVVFEYEPMQTIWKSCQSAGTSAYLQLTNYMITHGVHDGKPTDTSDVISEMVNVATKTGVERQAVIKYLNDWGRKGLTLEEENLDFATVLAEEAWIDVLEADKNEFSQAILKKYYTDCGSQLLSKFVDSSNAWIATNYWAKIMKRVALDDDFWKTSPSNAAEIVNHLIDGICIGTVTESTMDEQLLESLLSHVKFTDVSTKVNEVMDKFSSTYQITLFKFKKLHNYFEKAQGHGVVFLNKILRPIIDQETVQAIILGNLKVYESLLKDNMEQASDLKVAMVRQHGSSGNQEWVALINRLGIIEEKEEKINE